MCIYLYLHILNSLMVIPTKVIESSMLFSQVVGVRQDPETTVFTIFCLVSYALCSCCSMLFMSASHFIPLVSKV